MPIRFATIAFALLCPLAHADQLDDLIHTEMQQRHVPGLSIAVIDGGKIVRVAGYGVTEVGGVTPVTPATLFQAGSVSKSVTATAALQLVEQGKLMLDEDINMKLVSWKVPDNEFTKDRKVTLRGLLSHSAGMNVHGFPGYAVDATIPSLVQVLDSEKPANTEAIRVEAIPGSGWAYSGGGYTVVQQAMLDVAQQAFPDIMQAAVLQPFGMRDSTYAQPLPAAMAGRAASGTLSDRSPVAGHWHVYPEMAAAGLWSNPSDLARFVIGIQQSHTGQANPVISRDMTRQMLSVQKAEDGLGVFLAGSGNSLVFSHNGRNEGFDSLMKATAATGQGAVIMINTNDNSRMMTRIMDAVARQYHWPDAAGNTAPPHEKIKPTAVALAAYGGYYDMGNGGLLSLATVNGHLTAMADGDPDDSFVALGADHLVSQDGVIDLRFTRHGGKPDAVQLTQGSAHASMPRIGPLAHTLAPAHDAHPERRAGTMLAVAALAQGGDAVQKSDFLSDTVKKALGTTPVHEFEEIKSLDFIAERNITGKGFQRFGGGVATVVYYKINGKQSPKYLIVYFTQDGLLADADIVDA